MIRGGRLALLAGVVLLVGCAPKRQAEPVLEFNGPELPREAVERYIDQHLPGMGALEVAAREEPQRRFEQLCHDACRPGREADRRLVCTLIAERLGPETPRQARLWMLRHLAYAGRAECVPALERLLEEEEPRIREHARRALAHNPSMEAGVALRAALEEADDPEWQVALIEALGPRGEAESVEVLSKLAMLAGAEHRAVARAAIAALGVTDDVRALLLLKTLAREQIREIHADVVDALLLYAERALAQGRTEQAVDIYDHLTPLVQREAARIAVLRGLVALRTAEMLPQLLALIADEAEPWAVRVAAAEHVVALRGAGTTVGLIQLLRDATPETRVLVLRALAARVDEEARPVVLAQLDRPEADVRAAAWQALGVLGDLSSLGVLAQKAAGAEGAEREAAGRMLARWRGAGVDEEMLRVLSGAEPASRVVLIEALAARHDTTAVPALLGEAEHADEAVRVAAWRALGDLAGFEVAPELVARLVASEGGATRSAAEDVVVKVCLKAGAAEAGTTPLLRAWDAAAESERPVLIAALGRMGSSAALARIRPELEAENGEVVDAAVRALAQWPDAAPLSDLLDVARRSEKKTRRVLALRGAVAMVERDAGLSTGERLELYVTMMSLAEREEEKRLVLAGASQVRDPKAVAFVKPYLAHATLRGEAAAAVVTIAERIGPRYPQAARAALAEVMAQGESETTRRRCEEALALIRAADGCITTWQSSGPYAIDGKDWTALFDRKFEPERRGGGRAKWQALPVTNDEMPWVFDLVKLDQGQQRCVYLRCAIWSDRAQPVQLQVGSDDGVQVWLNERRVHERREVRGHRPLEDKVAAQLERGWNQVLVKVVQAAGGWGVSAAVRAVDGEPLSGVRIVAVAP